MVLTRALYDSTGNVLFELGKSITEEDLTRLTIYGVGEILIEDWRVADVAVQPLIAPELEAEASQALKMLITESQGSSHIDDALLVQAEQPIYAMTRDLFPEVIGEANASGCNSIETYKYLHPAKVAGLALLMGRRAGYGLIQLASLGMAGLLMNVGYLRLPPDIQERNAPLTDAEAQAIKVHPKDAAELLSAYKRLGPESITAILQHHERWDGSGFPEGLKGDEISLFARILAIAD